MSDEGTCGALGGSHSAAFAITELRHWLCTKILKREWDDQKRSGLLAKPLVPSPQFQQCVPFLNPQLITCEQRPFFLTPLTKQLTIHCLSMDIKSLSILKTFVFPSGKQVPLHSCQQTQEEQRAKNVPIRTSCHASLYSSARGMSGPHMPLGLALPKEVRLQD